ncbi:MAG TPA: 16S rRNA (uracil(1498)-N(3))-methyltransferase [Steroidobacteraceae bacterium]|jgi:16S rRNA (uracil1498-N3)-methyltransferase|nr:16S rRNA (uracil(1498)-N(3))-methyltransferase [Steroidobacteraceae bacterium]
MRLTRVYVETALTPGTIVELPRETASHLAKVLRARNGDQLVLFSGDGREYVGSIESVRGARVTAAVGAGTQIDRESPFAITLVQCVPRGDRMDFIVQKATELGVARIVPVLSQRSIVRLDEGQKESKAAHWRAVAVSACEQCGRNRLPNIEAPAPLINYLGTLASTTARLVLEPDLVPAAPPSNLDAAVEIAIGPEGGFADDELDAFRIAGFVRVRLGPRILRTETAAIAALTWLQTRFGDMRPLQA